MDSPKCWIRKFTTLLIFCASVSSIVSQFCVALRRYKCNKVTSDRSILPRVRLLALYVYATNIGVGDGGTGGGGQLPPAAQKNPEKYFSGKNHVKFGHFVNFSCICHVKFGNFVNFSCMYFRAKMSCPPKLTELLRLWPQRMFRSTAQCTVGYSV